MRAFLANLLIWSAEQVEAEKGTRYVSRVLGGHQRCDVTGHDNAQLIDEERDCSYNRRQPP